MAGRLLRACRPSTYRPLKRRWPGRHKQAPGHDGYERANVIAGWHYALFLLWFVGVTGLVLQGILDAE